MACVSMFCVCESSEPSSVIWPRLHACMHAWGISIYTYMRKRSVVGCAAATAALQ